MMAAKRKPKSEQSRRFIEAAREVGADVPPEEFERAFKRLVPPKRPKPSPPKQSGDKRRS